MNKKILTFLGIILVSIAFATQTLAADLTTALPKSKTDCSSNTKFINLEEAFRPANNTASSAETNADGAQTSAGTDRRIEVANEFATYTRDDQYEVLACALKKGTFHLFMVPYMIRYFVEVIIQLAGLVCVLFIVIGSYQYMIGSLSDNKQQGKDTIKNALIGLVITLLSWIIVNFVQVALTGSNL